VIQSLVGTAASKTSSQKPAKGTQTLVAAEASKAPYPKIDDPEYDITKVTVTTSHLRTEWRYHDFEVAVETLEARIKRSSNDQAGTEEPARFENVGDG